MTVTNKIAAQVLQKAFQESLPQSTPTPGGESHFQNILDSVGAEYDLTEILGQGQDQILGGAKTAVLSAESIPLENQGEALQKIDTGNGQKLVDMLADFNQQQIHMDGLINEVMYGKKKFNNSELLVIQAHVFNVAQMTEVTVKTVEFAVSGFKGVMNTQIQ